MSVCVSRTICVCTGEKWFRTFVRGTVRTENEIVSVCVHCPVSSTICVNRTETAKWFKPFVRGTFETETSLNPVLALSLVDSQSYSGANCAPNNHCENGFKTQHTCSLPLTFELFRSTIPEFGKNLENSGPQRRNRSTLFPC